MDICLHRAVFFDSCPGVCSPAYSCAVSATWITLETLVEMIIESSDAAKTMTKTALATTAEI